MSGTFQHNPMLVVTLAVIADCLAGRFFLVMNSTTFIFLASIFLQQWGSFSLQTDAVKTIRSALIGECLAGG